MSSKDSTNMNNSKTNSKAEPSTSTLLKNVKTEPGLSALPTRLTSFRVPRDLTLGANIKLEKPKKVYTPNINVQRNKKKEDGDSTTKESKPARNRGRGRGQGDRGRGRGKNANTLIQSTGVFSEGINEATRTGRRISGYREHDDEGRAAKVVMEKPVLKLNQTVNEADEEKKLKSLLRDDFIDDGNDLVLDNAPIVLPLEGKLFDNEPKDEDKMDIDSPDDNVDVKPIILANGTAVMPSKIKSENGEREHGAHITIPQVIETQSNGYILIQFPDCLPGFRAGDEQQTDPRNLRRHGDQRPPPASDDSGKPELCTVGNLKGGLLGKIQICKSGKARLVLGDNSLIMDVGSRLSFRQDLIAAKLDEDNANGELINLGRITSTLVCSPDWETMLSSL